MRRLQVIVAAVVLGGAVTANAQPGPHGAERAYGRDPYRSVPSDARSGPINVPSYSPPLSPYPASPVNPPVLTPSAPRSGVDRRHVPVQPPVVVMPAQVYYFCPDLGAYYPQIQYCPSSWSQVYGPPQGVWR
jgi:hypothetical protein